MRYVGLLPHPGLDVFEDEAVQGLVGTNVPYRVDGEVRHAAVGRVVAARVDHEGIHVEIETEPDAEGRQVLDNLVAYGTPHGPGERVPTRPMFSIGGGWEVSGEIDPLLQIGCVQPTSALDDQRSRDALRTIVRAATERFQRERNR